MNTLNSLKLLRDTGIGSSPNIVLPGIYLQLNERYYFEFFIGGEKILFSPFYSILNGTLSSESKSFFEDNEELLDQIKEFSIKYLFFFSSIIEENFPYLSQPNDIVIFRYVHKSDTSFEIKLYAHNEAEVDKFYNDKFYIGRSFINLINFYPDKMLIPAYLRSIYDQNIKIQERARLKINSYIDYTDELQEINELCQEVAAEDCKPFPTPSRKEIFNSSLKDFNLFLERIIEINEVIVELKEIIQDFETKLRINGENDFVKNLIKFKKDILNLYQYLHKIFNIISYFHLLKS